MSSTGSASTAIESSCFRGHMFERGDDADALWIVIEGVIQGFEEIGGQWLLVATTSVGEVTGMLPFSAHDPLSAQHGRSGAIASAPTREKHFQELLRVSEEFLPQARGPDVGPGAQRHQAGAAG